MKLTTKDTKDTKNRLKLLARRKRWTYLPRLQAECIGRSSLRRGEESPDSAGQDVLLLKQELRCDIAGDGKCRRKYTACPHRVRAGKGEKVG